MTRPSASSSAGDAAATSLAPGFRFHPTDEELVSYYLKRKVLGRPLQVDAIAEVDLYKVEPWDLPGRSRLRRRHAPWYFFSPLDRKHSNRARTNRTTVGGYWKTTGKDREVRHGARVVGMKKTLVFHAGRAPKGERTKWVMHEYRLDGRDAAVALARIPQDSYVVCRIFQKSGPGPQNGAQYGAPFVEDDWEGDEEDVGLLPVERDGVCDDEAPGSMDKGYLQMNDLQDLGEQTENSNLPMPVFDTSNNNNHSEDADRSSGVVLNDPSLDNFLQYIEPEENKCTVCSENMVPNTNAGEFSFNSSPNDEYLELKDFVDAVNLEYPLGDDSTIWPSDGWPWETAPVSMEIVNGADGRTGMQELCNSEFPPITGEETFEPDELEQLLKSIQGDTQMDSSIINPPLSSTNFVKPEDEGLMFYDAPIDPAISDDSFRQFNQYHNSRASNLSGVDIMRYHDALDDILVSDILGPVQEPDGIDSCAFNGSVLAHEVDNTTYTYNPAQKVLEPNFVVGAPSSSSRLPEGGSKLKFQNDCIAVPDAETSTSSIGKHFVKMLDSISAPPAFAAEFPVTHISGTHSNAIRLSAEVISIGSLTVASCPKNWPLKNNEDFELLFSTGFEPDTRVQYGCNSVATVLGGSFCLFFLSAMMLLVSYKVGMCIYGK